MTRSDMVKGMECIGLSIGGFCGFCTKYATTMSVLFVYPDFPLGDISYLSRFYGTDVRGHVQNDILFNFCYIWR